MWIAEVGTGDVASSVFIYHLFGENLEPKKLGSTLKILEYSFLPKS